METPDYLGRFYYKEGDNLVGVYMNYNFSFLDTPEAREKLNNLFHDILVDIDRDILKMMGIR